MVDGLFMCYSVSRNDRETYFVDAISEFVDFAGVVVVNNRIDGCLRPLIDLKVI